MSKRPGEALPVGGAPKHARVEVAAGVVKKSGPRLPMLAYKEGEALHDLKLFIDAGEDGGPQCVEVRIPAVHLSGNNRQVRSRQLWGSDIYTSDSDLVAVLMHYGYLFHTITQPLRDVVEVRVVVRPLPAQVTYASTARNSIRSRAWVSETAGCSYSVDKAWVVTRTGNSFDLTPSTTGPPAAAPTFAPSHYDRMITRSAAGPASRQRHVQEVTAVFNLVNEPWVKYTAATICDRGLKPHDWTSARLHSHVLYLESHSTRYELTRSKPGDGGGEECYKLSRCNRALTARGMRAVGVPLPADEVQVLEDGVQWEEFQWAKEWVVVREKQYKLSRVHFMPVEAPEEAPATPP